MSPDRSPQADLIRTPGGAFGRAPAILPRLLDELFPRREAAKKAGDDVASNAIKILMNSFYGVLGTPACRFYNPALANSITGTGREMLLWSKRGSRRPASRCCTATPTACSCAPRTMIRSPRPSAATRSPPRLNAELEPVHPAGRWRVAEPARAASSKSCT